MPRFHRELDKLPVSTAAREVIAVRVGAEGEIAQAAHGKVVLRRADETQGDIRLSPMQIGQRRFR